MREDLPATKFDAIEHPKKRGYLLALALSGVQVQACQTAGVARTTVWVWRQDDALFAELEAEAKRLGAETIVGEIYRRGIIGEDEPVYYRGQRIDTIKRKSDLCLLALANALLPDLFKRRHEIAGDRTRPLTVQVVQEGD